MPTFYIHLTHVIITTVDCRSVLLCNCIGYNKMIITFIFGLLYAGVSGKTVATSTHCSPPSGSVDGHVVVEDGGGGVSHLTTLTWQVALGSTLCYRLVLGKMMTLHRSGLADLSLRPAAWLARWR